MQNFRKENFFCKKVTKLSKICVRKNFPYVFCQICINLVIYRLLHYINFIKNNNIFVENCKFRKFRKFVRALFSGVAKSVPKMFFLCLPAVPTYKFYKIYCFFVIFWTNLGHFFPEILQNCEIHQKFAKKWQNLHKFSRNLYPEIFSCKIIVYRLFHCIKVINFNEILSRNSRICKFAKFRDTFFALFFRGNFQGGYFGCFPVAPTCKFRKKKLKIVIFW